MREQIVLHKDQIKELTWGLSSLNQEQRELMRDKLLPFSGKPLYRLDLIKMLRELKSSNKISQIDYDGLSESLLKFFES